MGRLYYPYVMGTDSPIPNLFEGITKFVADSGFEITTLTNSCDPIVKHPQVNEYYAMSSGSMLRRLQYVRLAMGKYNLVHTGGQAHYNMSRLLHARNRNLRHLHTFRVDVNSEMFPQDRKRKLLEFADRVSAVSEHTARTVKEVFDVDPVVIYNAVDTGKFRPDYPCPPTLTKLNSERPIFIFVGNFVDRKRPADVVKVAKRVSSAQFLMFGDGPLFPSIAESAQRLDNLTLFGRINKSTLPAIYSNSTGLLFPSVREGCPNVVLEAMASGTPVIGYRATSMPELITDGETGYLSQPTDVEGLVAGIRSLLATDRENMRQKARTYTVNNHTFEQIADNYLDVYNNML